MAEYSCKKDIKIFISGDVLKEAILGYSLVYSLDRGYIKDIPDPKDVKMEIKSDGVELTYSEDE